MYLQMIFQRLAPEHQHTEKHNVVFTISCGIFMGYHKDETHVCASVRRNWERKHTVVENSSHNYSIQCKGRDRPPHQATEAELEFFLSKKKV